ncbi:MAG TPA: response regulator transcription factor [Chloroflexota bacterium]|nr:response regulator transcription factor [Chloroflexota bacterium]
MGDAPRVREGLQERQEPQGLQEQPAETRSGAGSGKEALAALLVEPEEEYAALVEALLRRRGSTAERLEPDAAIQAARSRAFAVGLIDSEAKMADGRSVLRALREDAATAALPLIALSRPDGTGSAAGPGGADDAVVRVMERADYELIRPFSPRRFWAALRVVVGRSGAHVAADAPRTADEQTVGPLTLRHRLLEAQIDGRRIPLSPREFSLLYVLVSHPGVAFTRDELARRAWAWQPAGDSRAVDNMVRRLRRKLGDDGREPQLLRTQRGVGYSLTLPEDRPREGLLSYGLSGESCSR